MALVAEEDAGPDDELSALVAQPEGEVACDRDDDRGNEEEQEPELPIRRSRCRPASSDSSIPPVPAPVPPQVREMIGGSSTEARRLAAQTL